MIIFLHYVLSTYPDTKDGVSWLQVKKAKIAGERIRIVIVNDSSDPVMSTGA